MDEERQVLVARNQRARTPLERYDFELDVLHFDMENAKVWNNQLTREFMLRWVEIEQTYLETQKAKARWA